MAKQDIILNHIYLKNRVIELGIKQWWLAEQVGVDRKTVIRWIQGKVRTIQPENATALAEVLSCNVSDLYHSDEASQLATPEEQKKAALLLQTSSLIEKLGPIGEWDVIESLLKTSLKNLKSSSIVSRQVCPQVILINLQNKLRSKNLRKNKLFNYA